MPTSRRVQNLAFKGGALACALSALITSGCATIIRGTSEDMNVASNPAGAMLIVRDIAGQEVFRGGTPAQFKLPKKDEYVALIALPGYQPVEVQIRHSFDAWYLGNILCGGLIGLIVDPLTGAIWDLEPDQIRVSLVPGQGGPPPQGAPPGYYYAPAPPPPPPPPPPPSEGAPQSSHPASPSVVVPVAHNDASAPLYAVFQARDSHGNLRTYEVPLLPKPSAND